LFFHFESDYEMTKFLQTKATKKAARLHEEEVRKQTPSPMAMIFVVLSPNATFTKSKTRDPRLRSIHVEK